MKIKISSSGVQMEAAAKVPGTTRLLSNTVVSLKQIHLIIESYPL